MVRVLCSLRATMFHAVGSPTMTATAAHSDGCVQSTRVADSATIDAIAVKSSSLEGG